MIGLNDFERDGDEFYDNDPDSWALIPEFNKTPSSVDFKGFKYPMFGRGVRPEVSRSIFEMMKAVRTQARKRFASLKEIEALASKAIPSEALATAIVDAPSTLTSEGIFALRYELFCYYVAQFLVTYPKDMDNSIEPLALAAAEIAGMMNEKPIDAEEMQKIRAEIKNKRRTFCSSGRSGRTIAFIGRNRNRIN